MKYYTAFLAGLCLATLAGCGGSNSSSGSSKPEQPASPNILFIVVDDAGVDQFAAFGYGGLAAPATQNINAIANAGVRFRNTWSMPTCTPTRSTFFNGQYPFRTNIRNAVVSNDLANSQPSPYSLTIPKLLREEAGYVSALVGKMHLTGSELNPDNHPLGDEAMRELGWDYFAGYLDGAPYPIDTTAGGIASAGTYPCGFVPTTAIDATHGADFGVCYLPDNHPSGELFIVMPEEASPPSGFNTPGRSCVEMGGLFDPNTLTATEARREQMQFENQNGFYTAQWKINHEDGSNETLEAYDAKARGYRTILETDYAIDWIQRAATAHPGKPWMLTLGYSAMHTPLQPPPAHLLPFPDAAPSLTGCGTPVASYAAELGLPVTGDLADFAQQRAVAQHMLEAVDHEIGRLLAETGIAERLQDGTLQYNPDSNTVVVFVSDNGTYMPSVKPPFDPFRAKGSLYQSGIWVPLIVAGPPSVVNSPGRDVEHMVNTTDLFSLFRELAGINESRVPATTPIDAQPVRPYLAEPAQPAIRSHNFTEQGTNLSASPAPPCVIPAANTCVQIFPQAGVCEDQSGDWYGPDEHGAGGFDSCCAVIEHLNTIEEDGTSVRVFPHEQRALRNEHFKLVRVSRMDCSIGSLVDTEEFYHINQSADAATLKLDTADADLLADGEANLSPMEKTNLTLLRAELDAVLASAVHCPGDGNSDLVVDEKDLEEWAYWADTAAGRGMSSWYDLNHDGRTDNADRTIIEANLGTDCRL